LVYLFLLLLICHLPQDLHPSIEYTQRTTQRNKSITHSITGTARPAGSGLGRSRMEGLVATGGVSACQHFWLNSALCLSAALLTQLVFSRIDFRLIYVMSFNFAAMW